MSLPASITGAHAKKQGEDLSDNDGDEDEGIFHGEQRWCMNFCSTIFFFSTICVLFQFADSNIKQFDWSVRVCACV